MKSSGLYRRTSIFAESIAYDKEPESGFDLAYETMKVLYSAYVSAEEGRRVNF